MTPTATLAVEIEKAGRTQPKDHQKREGLLLKIDGISPFMNFKWA